MTSLFPYLSGNYAPVDTESTFSHEQLRIDGRVPDELFGAFMRNGPNPAFEPNHYVYPLDGDGMIHAVYFDHGRVSYRNRWVVTAALAAERRFGRRIYGSIGRMVPVPPEVIAAGGDPSPYKNTANTNVILHGDKLLALWEVGLPHLLTPGLDTVGRYDYGGTLRADQNLSAHPKICPRTREFITCTQGSTPPYWTGLVFDQGGGLQRRLPVELPFKGLIHDLAITEHYVVLLLAPAVAKPALLAEGRIPIEWRGDWPTRVVLVPRDGSGGVRIVETDPFFSWHFCNAYEHGDTLIVDYVWIETLPFAQAQGTGVEGQPRRMHRLTIHPATDRVTNERVTGTFCEFARVNDRYCGLPYRYGYAAASTMAHKGEHHGYNCTARFDFGTGDVSLCEHGPQANAGEPVCVPKHGAVHEDQAWIMTFATTGGDSFLAIFDGEAFDAGPVARIHVPTRVPNGFHANWMPALRAGS